MLISAGVGDAYTSSFEEGRLMLARRLRRWLGYATQIGSDLKWHRRFAGPEMPSRARRIVEQARLLIISGIDGEDYYNHGLFRKHMPFSEKVRFLGYYEKIRYYDTINPPVYDIVARDKVLFHLLAKAVDIPVPAVHAVTRYKSQPVCGRELSDLDALERFLKDPESQDFFFKPAGSSFGEGALSLGKKITGELAWRQLPGDDRIELRDILDHVQEGGVMRRFLIQERLRPHPVFDKIVPDVCSTLRIMTYTKDGATTLLGAALRLGNGREATDNLTGGGVVVAVDADSGVLGDVVSLDSGTPQRMSNHPVTGVRISGERVPDWHELVALVTSAAARLSFIPCIGWDVGVTDEGPVIVEINTRSRCRPIQVANDRGMLTGPLLEALLSNDGTVKSGLNLRRHLGRDKITTAEAVGGSIAGR